MERYSPEWSDLAPRDVVARAIYWEMLANDYPYVLLDIASHKPADYIRERFPEIYARCLEQNIDITARADPGRPRRALLLRRRAGGPVGPHHAARAVRRRRGLLHRRARRQPAGQHVACWKGWSGAPGPREHIRKNGERRRRSPSSDVPPWDVSDLRYDADPALIQGDMETIRNLMWHYVGLVRARYRLTRAIRELSNLWLIIEDFYRRAYLTDELIGLRNAAQAALLVARAAMRNRTSRGCHYRDDSRTAGHRRPAAAERSVGAGGRAGVGGGRPQVVPARSLPVAPLTDHRPGSRPTTNSEPDRLSRRLNVPSIFPPLNGSTLSFGIQRPPHCGQCATATP